MIQRKPFNERWPRHQTVQLSTEAMNHLEQAGGVLADPHYRRMFAEALLHNAIMHLGVDSLREAADKWEQVEKDRVMERARANPFNSVPR
jgi:hypothetical protein